MLGQGVATPILLTNVHVVWLHRNYNGTNAACTVITHFQFIAADGLILSEIRGSGRELPTYTWL